MDRKSGGEKVDGNETERLSGLSRPLVLPDLGEPGVVLCVRYPEGFQVVPLAEGVPAVIGRSGQSTVRIDHRTLSREHARFALAGGRLTVEDLGSKNGTYLAGAQVQRAELDVGDEVRLGSVEVSVQLVGPAGELLGVDGERHFMRQLEAELSRASELRRPFALLAVRSADAGQERAGAKEGGEATPAAPASLAQHWVPRVRAYLRSVDRVTLHGPGAIQVLLPEAGFEQAAAIARSVTGISAGGSPLRVGMAVYPEAGQTVDTLIERTWRAVQSTSESEPVRAVSTAPWREAGPSQEEGIVVGAVLRELMETAERVARSRIPVLLHGETGSGKEVLARFIHDHGPRKARRMVRVNCGSIPALLVESTLFGHERGSFTGAIQQQKGVFEEADGGTVFLDEIGELPPAVQVALLRVLETGTFCRVGSNRELAVDVRLIAATHRDLEAMVERGQFRADLLYRLNTMTLIVPPLRSRTDELEPLARRFLKVANEGSGRAVLGFTPEVLELFRAYAWPGNVRELRNVIERAVVVARGALIEVRDLPGRIQASGAGRGASAAVAAQDRDDGPVSSSGSPTPGPPSGPVAEVAEGEEDPLAEEGGELKARVQRYEARLIRAALEAAGWNRAEAAKALGLPLRTLAHKIKVLEIEKPSR